MRHRALPSIRSDYGGRECANHMSTLTTAMSRAFQQRTFADKAEAEAFPFEYCGQYFSGPFRRNAQRVSFELCGRRARALRSASRDSLQAVLQDHTRRRVSHRPSVEAGRPLHRGARHERRCRWPVRYPSSTETRRTFRCARRDDRLLADCAATSVAARAGDLIGDDGGLGSPHQTAVMLDHADPVVKTLVRNVSNVFHEMQNLSHIGLSSLAVSEFRRSVAWSGECHHMALGAKPRRSACHGSWAGYRTTCS